MRHRQLALSLLSFDPNYRSIYETACYQKGKRYGLHINVVEWAAQRSLRYSYFDCEKFYQAVLGATPGDARTAVIEEWYAWYP